MRTVRYTYYKNGRASNITIFDAGDLDGEDRQLARDLALYYAASGSLWLAIRGTWSIDGKGDVVEDSYATIDGREFRYDSLRGRYLSRAVDTGSSADPTEWTFGDALWTDYDGDEPYLDFSASIDGKSIATVPTTRYTRAGGTFAQQSLDALGDPVSTRYYHADLVGSTTALTDEAGEIPTGGGAGPVRLTYTAFGEAVVYDTGESEWKVTTTQPSGSPRYQYAGAHGYESDLLVLEGKPGSKPIMLKHVGARWYQPDIGRFIQRDPIGLAGGLSVYLYCGGNPVDSVDPRGLDRWIVGGPHRAIVVHIDNRYIELGIKMDTATGDDDRWWHYPKDIIQDIMNAALCGTIGGVGTVYHQDVGAPTGPPTIPTAPEEDRELLNNWPDGERVYYNIWWRNCQHWVASNQGDGTGH
ncbi:MAG: RHS repeat-associated core domain-containing protein [Phycisphaerae bacterium]